MSKIVVSKIFDRIWFTPFWYIFCNSNGIIWCKVATCYCDNMMHLKYPWVREGLGFKFDHFEKIITMPLL